MQKKNLTLQGGKMKGFLQNKETHTALKHSKNRKYELAKIKG